MSSPELETKPAESSPPVEKSREEQIQWLLYCIGGNEESLRLALEYRDYDVIEELKKMKTDNYKKLRRIMNGLPETPIT